MTSKSASTTRRATPAARPTAKAEAGSRPPTTVSDAVSAVAGLGGTSTNATQSPGSPSVARIGGSGTILSFARARSLQRTVGNQATRAVLGPSHPVASATKNAMTPSEVRGTTSLRTSESVSTPAIQREFGDSFRSNEAIAKRDILKVNIKLVGTDKARDAIFSGKKNLLLKIAEEGKNDTLGILPFQIDESAIIQKLDEHIEEFDDQVEWAMGDQDKAQQSLQSAEKMGLWDARNERSTAAELAARALGCAEKAVDEISKATELWNSDELKVAKQLHLQGDQAKEIGKQNDTVSNFLAVYKISTDNFPSEGDGDLPSTAIEGGLNAIESAASEGDEDLSSVAGNDTRSSLTKATGMSKEVSDGLGTAAGLLANLKETFDSARDFRDDPSAKNAFELGADTAGSIGGILDLALDEVPGVGAIEHGLKLISAGLSTHKGYLAWSHFRDEKRNLKKQMGMSTNDDWLGSFRLWGSGMGSGEAKATEHEKGEPQKKDLAEKYRRYKDLQYVKGKNIDRGVFNIVTESAIVAGEIAALTGVGTVPGKITAWVGKGARAAGAGFRWLKRDDAHESKKLKRYHADVRGFVNDIRLAATEQYANPESSEPVDAVIKVNKDLDLAGYPIEEMALAKNGKDLFNQFVIKLKDRES